MKNTRLEKPSNVKVQWKTWADNQSLPMPLTLQEHHLISEFNKYVIINQQHKKEKKKQDRRDFMNCLYMILACERKIM